MGAVPVINENDTVATAEIRFGDNDRLAARVAAMISADTLVLLSDIDGLYTADPRKDKSATHIAEITEMTPEIEAMAGEAPHRLFLRRHGDQARGRAHRDERRLPHGDRRRPPHESAAGDPRWRHLLLVPAGLRAEDRAQALDRRLAEADRHAGGR